MQWPQFTATNPFIQPPQIGIGSGRKALVYPPTVQRAREAPGTYGVLQRGTEIPRAGSIRVPASSWGRGGVSQIGIAPQA